jgi:hypothetical protein
MIVNNGLPEEILRRMKLLSNVVVDYDREAMREKPKE